MKWRKEFWGEDDSAAVREWSKLCFLDKVYEEILPWRGLLESSLLRALGSEVKTLRGLCRSKCSKSTITVLCGVQVCDAGLEHCGWPLDRESFPRPLLLL